MDEVTYDTCVCHFQLGECVCVVERKTDNAQSNIHRVMSCQRVSRGGTHDSAHADDKNF